MVKEERNSKLKKILNNKLAGIVLVIIFIVLLPQLTNGINEIKIALGFPNIHEFIDNKNSLLPDELIDRNYLNSNWKFRNISTSQREFANNEKIIEMATRIFMGSYKSQPINLSYVIFHYKNGINLTDEINQKWKIDDDDSTIELLQSSYTPILDIYTHCYNRHLSLDIIDNYSECSMFKIKDQNLIQISFSFYEVTDLSTSKEIIAELEQILD